MPLTTVETSRGGLRKALGLAVATALTALALWLVFRNVDGATLSAALHKQDSTPLAIAAIAIVLQIEPCQKVQDR